MRRAIFVRFIEVLLAALLLNSGIFFIVTNTMLLQASRNNMRYMLSVLDSIIDYEGNVKFLSNSLKWNQETEQGRLTVMDLDGTVVFDTQVNDPDAMDNHARREEVEKAKRDGVGYSMRHSETLGRTMLYVAQVSAKGDYILRMAMPFSGFRENLVMFLPAFWLSLVISMLVCILIADKFSRSISDPLDEIARQMGQMNERHMELEFEKCQYPEINVIADTTMKMSSDLREYLAQIERERHIRQEFFSNASHELKTPLTSIQGYAELLENDIIPDEATKKNFLTRILEETRHMANVINDILMISKLETREVEVVKTSVDLRAILLEAANTVKPLAVERNVLVHADCPSVTYFANALQMKELFNNLLSNAVKYNRLGGQVWAFAVEGENGVTIRVKDTGVGISKEHIGRIFERFYRVEKGRSRRMGGTGLGLSIVKHIVSYYGGTIHVESTPDVGTEFIIFLPKEPKEKSV